MTPDPNTGAESRDPANRVFQEGRLTLGLTLPLVRPGQRDVDFTEQINMAKLADQLGFAALWIRDVPLNSPTYPDPVGHLDPWVLLGALATNTTSIALVTGAIVLTLRHPLHIAKAAVSVDTLSHGRLILGLGSGDRPREYAAFGRDGGQRRELFRRHWEQLAAALAPEPRVIPDGEAEPADIFELRPRPIGAVPMLAVGSAGQSVDWIARHAIGWATYHRPPDAQRDRYLLWRAAVDRAAPGAFRCFSVAMRLDLEDRQDAPATPVELGYRAGSRSLLHVLEQMRESGVHHVSLNLSVGRRPAPEMLEELARDVLPALAR